MTLTSGTTIGPYEILSLLGSGGMGEVYRARDQRLDRIVAVKILHSGLAANSELHARFEREARAISALSHPNIGALYDIGHHDGIEFLVMEYLEGETLAERIARGPMPISQVIRIGVQIADALQHAHRAGITHRDLKPGNIMLTSSGAKLLDFGLAKLIESTPGAISSHSAATLRLDPLTAEGTIVGTVPYMSPEQIEGKTLDHRTDIFSLGVILYEMTTGQRPFSGGSPASLAAAILATDPRPIRALQPASPPALERIIHTALEKHPDERWQTAQDVGRQLRWLSDSSLTSEQPVPLKRRSISQLLVVAVTAVAAGLLVWGGMRFFTPPAKPSAVRLQFVAPPEIRLYRTFDTNTFALSPDGRNLCFTAGSGGAPALYVRRLGSFEIKKIEGTDDASGPFWSSDNESIGFSARGKLWKTKVSGQSSPVAICDVAAAGAVGAWSGRTILFADRPGGRRPILRVADDGGKAVEVTSVGAAEWRHSWPSFLPDGDHFLYSSFAADSIERHLVLGSLSSPERTVLVGNASRGCLNGKDKLIFVRDGKLMTQHFDPDKRKSVDDAVTIADAVSYFQPTARADFDAAAGVIVYRTETSTGRLLLVDRKGVETRIIDDKKTFFDHTISPDGRKAAVTIMSNANGYCDIWIYDLVSGVAERFTSEPGMEVSPVWNPDGRSIAYANTQSGALPHLVQRSLTASAPEDLLATGGLQMPQSFSPDGLTLLYEEDDVKRNSDVLQLDMKTKRSTPVLNTPFLEGSPQVSPDGKWLAFTSDATGSQEVYIQSLSAGDPVRVRVSASGGRGPRWRRDSQELFYVSPERAVVSVTPRTAGHWSDTQITELFRTATEIRGFAALPDGQSFLISNVTPGAADSMFHVMVE